MSDSFQSHFLNDDARTALKRITGRRKVEALVWKRARALLLLDAGEDEATVRRILEISSTRLLEWRKAYGRQATPAAR